MGVLGVGGVCVLCVPLVWTEEPGEEHPGDRFSSHSLDSLWKHRRTPSSGFETRVQVEKFLKTKMADMENLPFGSSQSILAARVGKNNSGPTFVQWEGGGRTSAIFVQV